MNRFTIDDFNLIKAQTELIASLVEALEEHAPHRLGEMEQQVLHVDSLAKRVELNRAHDMWVIVYEPSTDNVLVERILDNDEVMDEYIFAARIARNEFDAELDTSDGYIPNCSGDIRVEFRKDPDNGTVIFSGRSFYFKREE